MAAIVSFGSRRLTGLVISATSAGLGAWLATVTLTRIVDIISHGRILRRLIDQLLDLFTSPVLGVIQPAPPPAAPFPSLPPPRGPRPERGPSVSGSSSTTSELFVTFREQETLANLPEAACDEVDSQPRGNLIRT